MGRNKGEKRSRRTARASSETIGLNPSIAIARLQRERSKLADDLAAARMRIAELERQRSEVLARIDRAIALLQALLESRG